MLKQWKSARPPVYCSICLFYRGPMNKKLDGITCAFSCLSKTKKEYKMYTWIKEGATEAKCRLLISRIFDAMEIHCIKNPRN